MSPELDAALPAPSSDRVFGFVMAGALALLSLIVGWKRSELPPLIWPVLSVFFATFALFYPPALAPLNWLWIRLGRVLHRVMSPLVLGVLYFGFVTPFSLFFRLVRPDPLSLRWGGSSYWIERPEGTQPGGRMEKQF